MLSFNYWALSSSPWYSLLPLRHQTGFPWEPSMACLCPWYFIAYGWQTIALLQCSTVSVFPFSSPSWVCFVLFLIVLHFRFHIWLFRRMTFHSWACSEEICAFRCQNIWVVRGWELNKYLETCVIFDALPRTERGCDSYLPVWCWLRQRERLFQTEKKNWKLLHPVTDCATAVLIKKKKNNFFFSSTLLLC